MRIAAGVGENKNILEASKRVDFEVLLIESEKKLIDLLLDHKVNAVVRGSLSASRIMGRLTKIYGDKISRASVLELNDHKFLLSPVGIDEGNDASWKVQIIESGAEFLRRLDINPKIAVLSGGRAQDVGRSPIVDASIAQAEQVIAVIKDKYTVKHYFILIEEAMKDKANFILAPDGITGNLIFRTLVFLGSGKSHGAITLGIDEIFVDTSRSQSIDGYIRALKFANYLAIKLKDKS